MFGKLKNKWNVSTIGFVLVICTFAIGGSLCGYAGRKILSLFPFEKGVLWYLTYVLLITLLWPVAVLLVSIPLGQFSFFRNYISRILKRMGFRK